MAHEEQNDPVAQSSTSKSPTTSTADLSERDNKEIPVVKEEETNDMEVFEEVAVGVARSDGGVLELAHDVRHAPRRAAPAVVGVERARRQVLAKYLMFLVWSAGAPHHGIRWRSSEPTSTRRA